LIDLVVLVALAASVALVALVASVDASFDETVGSGQVHHLARSTSNSSYYTKGDLTEEGYGRQKRHRMRLPS
jgi:hypothetical protein